MNCEINDKKGEDMYARLTSIHVKPDRIQEAVQLYRKSVVPEAKKQKGFKGLLLLNDPQTGDGLSITLWTSEKAALATEENRYYQEQLVKFMDFFALPPSREGYEVSLQVKA
jgi:heme-degrading monooxygenase HmoA